MKTKDQPPDSTRPKSSLSLFCCLFVCMFVCQDSAADFRERISDKYGRIRAVLDGDERLMMQIIDAEERYTTEWLETQRVAMETLIQEADGLRAQSRQMLQETNNLTFLQVDHNSWNICFRAYCTMLFSSGSSTDLPLPS